MFAAAFLAAILATSAVSAAKPACYGCEPNCPRPPYTGCGASDAEKHWNAYDWGLVHHYRSGMREHCVNTQAKGAFKCTAGTNGYLGNLLRHCEAEQVVLDMSKIHTPGYIMYNAWKDDGAKVACNQLKADYMPTDKQLKQSGVGFWWGHELEKLTVLGSNTVAESGVKCDRHFTKPAILLQTDFTHHIYHHFTSIINVWLSKHIAGLGDDNDVHIIFVDNFNKRRDLNSPPETFLGTFSAAWYPMTKHAILDSRHWAGQTLCFDKAVFTLPPRTSFWYPTRGVPCAPSHVITSFVNLMLANMTLPQPDGRALSAVLPAPAPAPLVVTYITRTGTRALLNEKALLKALSEAHPDIRVREVDFAKLSFAEQIKTARESKVLVGMHGAGLSHVMFLAYAVTRVALVEVYNTHDEFCFQDLAKLSGAAYFTWTAAESLLNPTEAITVQNAKHINYKPDPAAFVALISKAIAHVRGADRDEL